MGDASADARFFASAAEWRRWLEAHHETAAELWVGFHKKGTGRPSLTWPESVDAALCFGWIDGVRRRVDDERYRIRFTPRRPGSTWSAVNVRRMAELDAAGLVAPAGARAFAARTAERTGTYAYEQRQEARLSPEDERRFREDAAAWAYFQARPPGYRRSAVWWVVSAKQAATRERRLATLIADSAASRTLAQFTREPAGTSAATPPAP